MLDLALVDDAQASDVFKHEWWNRVVHLVDVPRCRQAFAQRAAYCPPAGTVEGLAPGENDAGIVLVDVVAVPGESFRLEEGVAKHVRYVLAVRQQWCEEMVEDVHAHRRGAPAWFELAQHHPGADVEGHADSW